MNNNLPDTFFEELDWSLLMAQAESLGSIAQRRTAQLTNDNCKKPVVNSQLINCKLLSDEEINKILGSVDDLIHDNIQPTLKNPTGFREWYIGRLFAIGPSEFIARADRTRKFGKWNKPAYFATLINKQ